MQSYSKGSLWPSLMLNYKGNVRTSMKGYNKGRLGPSISVHYNG
jgi:hypothetical protein